MELFGAPVKGVLFDRDGTLVVNVPYNRDPALVRPVPGARRALDRLRAVGFRLGVVTNQAGVARALISPDELALVNAQVEALLGTFDGWAICVHDEAAGCACRKPAPGLITDAAGMLGITPAECVVVGDIGSDMAAAEAAGAAGILVPNADTLPADIAQARYVAPDLASAVSMILGDPALGDPAPGRRPDGSGPGAVR